MKQITFKAQVITLAIIHGFLLLLAELTKVSLFNNAAWIIWGLVFIINPVWPKVWEYLDHDEMKLGCRIGGVLLIAVGLLTRFGV